MNVMNDRISIAMATFNGEKYLREQLDSIYSQTLLPNETVAVDDCSTDRTTEILEEYRIKKGLKYFVNKHNIGVIKNFEKAISLCQGDYVALSDQDDIWFPEKLEKSYNKLKDIENTSPAMISSRSIYVDSEIKIYKKFESTVDSLEYYESLWGHGNSQGCTFMLNRKLINHILPFPDGITIHDSYISFVAAMIGYKYNMAEALMYYRHHEGNVLAKATSLKTKSFLNKLKDKEFLKEEFPNFISNNRFVNMRQAYKQQKEYINKERAFLIEKILSLKSSKYFIKKISIIISLSDISLKRRCKVLIFFVFSKIAKIYVNIIIHVSNFIKRGKMGKKSGKK